MKSKDVTIKLVSGNKKQFLDLLLLGDEQESMIDRYLEQGDLFALYDGDLKSVCVVAEIDGSTCELKNIATYAKNQGQGYGSMLMDYVFEFYREKYETMLVGTGDIPSILSFYKNRGFELSYRVKNFFTDNYDHPIVENGIRLVDMVYLKKNLCGLHLEKKDDKAAKPLTEMSNEELWQLFPIILSEYKEHWKDDYLREAKLLEEKIGVGQIERINHIGSTAVPGLLSKPTIDILLEIKENTDLDKLVSTMESAGYIYSPQPDNPPPHMMFLKGYSLQGFQPPVYHVHIRYPGDQDEIYFRDYLREHPEAAREYAQLKPELKERYEHDRDGYTKAKTEFIQQITRLGKKR